MTAVTLTAELTRIETALWQKRDTLDSLNRQWQFHKRIFDAADCWNEVICAGWNLGQTERRIAVIEREIERIETIYHERLKIWAVKEVEELILNASKKRRRAV